MNDTTQRPLTVGKRLGYSIGAFGDSVGFNIFYFFFLFFLTDIAGIPPAIAGTITLIAVAWDAITDPIIGYLSDNLKSKSGRRRPFMITSAIPYAICTCQQILDTNFKKLFSYIVRLHKPYDTLDIAPRNAGQLSPTV